MYPSTAKITGTTFNNQIENGRYRNTPLNDRICQICKTNRIEDEFHVICICNEYQIYEILIIFLNLCQLKLNVN